MDLKIPFQTFVKLFLFILFLICCKILGPLVLSLMLSSLIAISLQPILRWLQRKGLSRGVAIATITLGLALVMTIVFMLIGPQIYQEITNFMKGLPDLKVKILGMFPTSNPLHGFLEKNLTRKALEPHTASALSLLTAGGMALESLADLVLILTFAIYLLADGERALDWFRAFFSDETQKKILQTQSEVSKIVSSYVSGQLITSFIAFTFVAIILTVLGVPSALLLATLAGIFDVLPVLGFFLAVIPAMIFALTVSPTTALIVFALYVLFHAVENYLIVPAVYGNRLRVSGLVVLLTLIAAGLVAGVGGAIIALPIAASYPIVERIWLQRYLRRSTLEQHCEEKTVTP